MLGAFAFCAAAQVITFVPFWITYKQDRKKYGSDLGVPLKNRFAAWLIMFPIWAIPLAVMLGGSTC